jgi:hypothetical protein
MLARQDKRPTSSRRFDEVHNYHLTQSNIPATSPQKPSEASIR